MSECKTEIPAAFWITMVVGIAAAALSPRFFDRTWGRHRTPVA